MSYSPKIKEELVRKLYLLKHSSKPKKPMTRIVNEAIEQYLERKDKDGKERKESI